MNNTNTTSEPTGSSPAGFDVCVAALRHSMRLTVQLPAGTEVTLLWGEAVMCSWEPSRQLTREDVSEAEAALVAAGCGTATAQSIARRWSQQWEEFAPEPGGRKPRSVGHVPHGPLATAQLGEGMSLQERRPVIVD